MGISVKACDKQHLFWSLTGRLYESDPITSIEINETPFFIGRRSDSALCLAHRTISGRHAEIFQQHEQSLWIRDLGSTNGTYVNGRPLDRELQIQEGDLLQFAEVAFRLCRESSVAGSLTVERSSEICDQALALIQFDRLMNSREVIPHYQPIVSIQDPKNVLGYEVLGRSRFYGLKMPHDLFLAASQLNLESELSRMFRVAGVQQGVNLPDSPMLFLNMHPVELCETGLLDSLKALRRQHPEQAIALEIHEAAITNPGQLNQIRESLENLDIRLAYDDFGAGSSRLLELSEVPPDYLKFDISLIRGIHMLPAKQQQMVESLVRMASDMGIATLAEGVEMAEEATVCRQIGFQYGQGYHYGKPASAHATARDSASHKTDAIHGLV
ncbi:MAG: EAL domain-containing protein [Pirellulales bacterium]